MDSTYAIQAEGLVKRYGETTALDGVDLSLQPGRVLGLLGPNGAGKTTVVRVLATLLRPDAGTARVGGFDVVRRPQRVRELIGLTGQYAAVDEDLTGQENLVLVARLLGLTRAEARRRAGEMLDRFGLAEAARRPVRTYSGGMRRRLDLAASLIGRPRVLFLDEPTTGLDPRSRGDVWDLVRDLVTDGMTVLLTTQYLDEADRLADEVVVVDHGRVVAAGTPAELKARTGGQTLDVRPADRAAAAAVAAIVAEAGGAAPVREAADGLVSAPVEPGRSGAQVLAEVARRLDAAGVPVAELGLRLAGLDEVFLALTGGPRGRAADEGAVR
ncbi:daunorubicin resistance protein DrrA family ABC transporter ATP-binding protein [Microbispora corallina]|uniref:Daunorubicin resistance protein DrrA family ABC transporter ATP-binding protein n=1 Tax=Microbispora corallina TaxID=83302 RepID=A0ABQ4G341_9ACTN|nr:ATP-binding cassette domain-containing protein [Microbispora corallina]GIH41491.1 daunorubicin resistance protein DrrA family ABC transporter ATP-binding protein [Microbispora corallina]